MIAGGVSRNEEVKLTLGDVARWWVGEAKRSSALFGLHGLVSAECQLLAARNGVGSSGFFATTVLGVLIESRILV